MLNHFIHATFIYGNPSNSTKSENRLMPCFRRLKPVTHSKSMFWKQCSRSLSFPLCANILQENSVSQLTVYIHCMVIAWNRDLACCFFHPNHCILFANTWFVQNPWIGISSGFWVRLTFCCFCTTIGNMRSTGFMRTQSHCLLIGTVSV